ncbi:ubiquitin-conjugating enzyme [Capsaspora owczarzaki ATCC 30864]|uniref:E2 ubiquitin-conjugating enzyme n=1 Tax=Capsaspora owczarzaki (strain ATCC 30864) TaxID=595528 RepID=A0A0D2WV30_CAPO3|nr:ubiquitin-conjugating enzyme [Capsaspora owczarzaki ATCC 30864]KJE96580.1 ubiquitin-conjugating enzyme [Capsaspora owczarzaki ATCC 30864]|eukprot:XP_004344504.1 ubiquitin-conjugating enzyme [Capsaspora owczarzaki ATCC 30864]
MFRRKQAPTSAAVSSSSSSGGVNHPAQAIARVKKEYVECQSDEGMKSCNIKLSLVEDSFVKLRGEIPGPLGTPFEGGVFQLLIDIPQNYPFNPPIVKFETKVWHPNVSSQTGVICLDILKDQWAAAMTLRTVMLSIQALMSTPEPDDPQDAVVANQYRSNREEYNRTAKYWTDVYARPGVSEDDVKIKQLMDMGFDEAKCKTALAKAKGNVEQAIEHLFA